MRSNEVFVFASNLDGIHGRGSALVAKHEYGAQQGVGVGRTGNAYAIPTKRRPTMQARDILTVDEIKPYVDDFIDYANQHPELSFTVVKIGCGLAGHSETSIAPLFKGAPQNVNLPDRWRELCSQS